VLLWLPFSIGQGNRLKKLLSHFSPIHTKILLIIIKLCPVYYVLNTQIISEIVIFLKNRLGNKGCQNIFEFLKRGKKRGKRTNMGDLVFFLAWGYL